MFLFGLYVYHGFCAPSSDFLFKFLVIGNAGTGKSCLLHQFIEKRCKLERNTLLIIQFL